MRCDLVILIVENLGTDLESATTNDDLLATLMESTLPNSTAPKVQMIQSIFAIRFANSLFENIWNCDHIDNVSNHLAEKLGVEERGGYYDESGALRDMVQTIPVIAVSSAMDKPNSFTEDGDPCRENQGF